MLDLDRTPLPPPVAIEQMVESRYGFSLVDLGITLQDLSDFDQIEIDRARDYNRCREYDRLEKDLIPFLEGLGKNDPEVVKRVAFRIHQIVHQILEASGRKCAWVCLRASTPANATRLFRWHFDAIFYPSKSVQYRFVMTLKGPQTLFYPIPRENKELRWQIGRWRDDQKYIAGLLDEALLFIPPREQGVIFMNREGGALHTEPPVYDQGRLFLSIVPCSEEEMGELERRVKQTFQILYH